MLPGVDSGKLWEGCRNPIKGTRQSALTSLGREDGTQGSSLIAGWNKGLYGKLNNSPVEGPGAERESAL